MKLKVNIPPSVGTLKEKSPSKSVIVPLVVPSKTSEFYLTLYNKYAPSWWFKMLLLPFRDTYFVHLFNGKCFFKSALLKQLIKQRVS